MDIPIAAAYVQIKRQRLRRQSVFLRRRIHYRLQYTCAYFVFVTVCSTFPVLSIIYIFNDFFVADITEKPGSDEQNTVPSTGFTLRASEPAELTT